MVKLGHLENHLLLRLLILLVTPFVVISSLNHVFVCSVCVSVLCFLLVYLLFLFSFLFMFRSNQWKWSYKEHSVLNFESQITIFSQEERMQIIKCLLFLGNFLLILSVYHYNIFWIMLCKEKVRGKMMYVNWNVVMR